MQNAGFWAICTVSAAGYFGKKHPKNGIIVRSEAAPVDLCNNDVTSTQTVKLRAAPDMPSGCIRIAGRGHDDNGHHHGHLPRGHGPMHISLLRTLRRKEHNASS